MKLILIFMSIEKTKIKVDKNEREYILFRIDVYFTEYFLAVEIDEQNHEGRKLIFEKNNKKNKKQKALEKKISYKFIRINTSNAKEGYDTDYEVSKIQINISKFKDKKIKEKENKIKELEDEIKKLKLQLTNQIKVYKLSKRFYQITDNEKHTIKNKTDETWKKTWNKVLFGV